MDTLINPDAVTGHNQPPDQLLEEANERIDAANKWLVERADIEKWDEEISDKAGGFRAQVYGTRKALDDRRLQEGRDFEAKQAAIYKEPLSLLKAALDAVDAKIKAYLKLKQDRLDAEKAKQEAAARAAQEAAVAAAKKAEEEAKKKGGDPLRAQLAADQAKAKAEEAAQAAAAPVERAAIKGTYTQRAVTLKTYWSARITDRGAAMRHYKANAILIAAIDEALVRIATAEAVAAKDPSKAPKGVEFYSEQR